ncbi:MAG: molybdopterin-dependent oxidoreductase [Acidimicrobiia bacterium]|nr:molybdopterin-dependent oxidoreductase [Acidimicrobiia bacterium]
MPEADAPTRIEVSPPPGPPPRVGITRRSFLGLSAAAAAAMAVFGRTARAAIDRLPWIQRTDVVTTHSVCDMCPWRCGILVHSVDGRIVKIDGNPADPKSRGHLCARGQAGISFLEDPDRLRTPLIRTGERGEGRFREASWEEALDRIASGMLDIAERHGPEAIAFLGHTSGDTWFVEYLAQAWGSPNAAKPSSSLCTSPREEAALLTVGRAIGGHEPVDWEGVEAIALIGSHVGEDARNTLMQDFSSARARGAKVVVVDPRLSTAASKADLWLPIKPGTDTALLLAWMNVLITEGRYDAEYLDRYASGFDELAAHVADTTPEWAAPITDLDPGLIRESARMLGDRRPRSVVVPGRHVTWYGNDTQRMRAVYIVDALLGAWGREGGLYFNASPYLEPYPHPAFTVAGSAGGCSADPGAEESDELPAGPTGKHRADGVRETFLRGPTALQELVPPMITGDPYPITGLVAYGINLLHSIPDPERTREALRRLDLVVAIDVLPQDHIAWADVVLPEATYLERHDDLWAVGHKTPYIAMREPAIPPMYDTKPGWWIARELGLRLGLERWFRWETAEEYLDRRLISIGSSLDRMREEGGIAVQDGAPYLGDVDTPFPTPTGTIELVSTTLGEAGHAPLPRYEPIEEPPAGHYRLLYGRHPAHTFAKTQNTPVLHELFPENAVWLNATEAARLGFHQRQEVWLENQDGAVQGPVAVRTTERIRPDCVFMVHGYGHRAPGMTRADGRGASDTALQTRYVLDPICGGAGMRVNSVRIHTEAPA